VDDIIPLIKIILMKKENKEEMISSLTELLTANKNFYLVDSSKLTVNQVNELRRICFNEGVSLQVVKNTLIGKALERANINEDFSSALAGPSSLMIAEDPTKPAKLIKEFRKRFERPLLKAAYIQESLYLGDENLDNLMKIKSKNQLIGEVLGMIQSPIQNVISGLKGQGAKIAGILKTLEEKKS
jgi:large subunit ribosomal protein L10